MTAPPATTPPEERRREDRLVRLALTLAATAAVGALIAVLVTVFVAVTTIDNRRAVESSVCAITLYADDQVDSARDNLSLVPPASRQRTKDSIAALDALTVNIRKTNIGCPPKATPTPTPQS